jgi:putative molybdopterin biosynthesis protein
MHGRFVLLEHEIAWKIMKSKDWQTAAEASERLGISRQQLYRLIDRGQLPAYRIGRLIRLRVPDVEAYRREHPPA